MDEVPVDRNAAQPPAQRGRDSRLFEIVVGTSAIMVSVVSLFVAISANRTQERMLAASVWPSLLFSTSNATPQNEPRIGFDLLNRGTGPARLRWSELSYDGQPVADWEDLLRRCCTDDPGLLRHAPVYTSGIQNRVLGVDEWVNMLQFPREGAPEAVWQALNRERHKVTLRTCYCSVLDDCWIFDSGKEDPEPVNRCPAPGKVLWQG